ncbi:threonyl-tRNA synthetase editing domain-containing protein [Nocardia sp. NPDC004573]
MQIVSTRCRTFEYTVTAAGPCAVESESAVGARRYFHDCLRVTVGVDHGDLPLAGAAVQLVRRVVDQTHAWGVVVDGLAHLSSGDLARPPEKVDVLSALADTVDVLAEFAERLEERGERVHLMPFGWRKDCRTEVVTGPGARQVIQLSADGDIRVHPGFREMRASAGWRRRVRCMTGPRPGGFPT